MSDQDPQRGFSARPDLEIEMLDSERSAGIALGTGGGMPGWSGYGIVLGAAAVALLALLAAGAFSIFLFFVVTVLIAGVATYIWARTTETRRGAKDRLVTFSITAAFGLAMLPLLSLIYTVISKGINRFDVAFFTESARGVVGAGGGASHAIIGTLVITGVATLISVPIGIMAAIYLNEYGTGRLRKALTFFVDVMTGIPSIVAGLFAYALFALILGPGIRLGVMGSIALTVLMIPIVIRSAEEILKIVPNHLREASYALGTPKWKTITKIVLPTALAGMITGVMLAVARIIGETAPLLVTTGVVDSINSESGQRPDAEPRRLCLQRVQEPRRPTRAFLRPRLDGGAGPDPDRHDSEPGRPLRVPPIRDRDPLAQWKRKTERCLKRSRTRRPLQTRRTRRRPRLRAGPSRPSSPPTRPRSRPPPAPRPSAWSPPTSASTTATSKRSRASTMTIEPNKVTALIGSCGCGKTTFLRSINRMHELTAGARAEGVITIDGQNIYEPNVDPVRVRRMVGMVFQQPNPFPTMSIAENVAAGLTLNNAKIKKSERDDGRRARAARRPSLGRGQGSPRQARRRPLRRPAAAALHRPGDRRSSPRSC